MASPVVESAADLTGKNRSEVEVRGTYGIQDLGGHALKVEQPDGSWKKVHRIAFVTLADGSFVSFESRPDEEMAALEGRHVIANGTIVIPAQWPAEPVMASPDPVPTLVEISSIEPAS